MKLADFDFALPPDLIAQHPASERSASRLLEVGSNSLVDRNFRDLAALFSAGDLLVMNDTRVLKARLLGLKEPSGGRVEALIERVTAPRTALAQVRASKTPRPGSLLRFGAHAARVTGRDGEFFMLEFDEEVRAVLDAEGRTPLPPYIDRTAQADDDARYQTVYAREPGSVAAPTAGLHFDDALLRTLREAGIELAWVTLHVGAGTFQPVRTDDIGEHRMHSERYEVPQTTADAVRRARERGARVIAVGTTSLRTLESVALAHGEVIACTGETDLFATPGFRFRVVDRLITNFHLPRSTLLMLVSAFAGVERIRRAYAHAIAGGYRFFSYGDAMLLTRCADALSE